MQRKFVVIKVDDLLGGSVLPSYSQSKKSGGGRRLVIVMMASDDINSLTGGMYLYSENSELKSHHCSSILSTSCQRTDIRKCEMKNAPIA